MPIARGLWPRDSIFFQRGTKTAPPRARSGSAKPECRARRSNQGDVPNKSQFGTSIFPWGLKSDFGAAAISRLPSMETTIRCGLLENEERREMADIRRERRAKTNIDAFLQHTSRTAIARTRTAIRRQELRTRFASINEVAQNKTGREFARQIGIFKPENDKPLH